MASVFDVIVVGAGPGGSNAAAVALKHGSSVAQVERFKFPRTKPCAGVLTIKACDALRLELAPTLRGDFREFEFNVWQTRTNRFVHRRSSLLRMVSRPEFDNSLVLQNLQSKRFAFFDGERVTDVTYDGVFRVETTRRTLRGTQLVGADGAYSVVNRLFKISRPRGHAVAVEVTLDRRTTHRTQDTPPCWDFGAIPYGYGWVFPKDDQWSVGLYTLRGHKQMRGQLEGYLAAKGFTTERDPLATFESHLFPYGGYQLSVPSVPVYIVGDAGGFGDAIGGEGIYHALESGRIAGETIAATTRDGGGHERYYTRIRRSVLADTAATYHVSGEVYRDVDRAMTILENPLVWRPFVQGYADGATFWQSAKQGGWFLAKSLVLNTTAHERTGTSLPLSFRGGLRGIPFVAESFGRRARDYLVRARA